MLGGAVAADLRPLAARLDLLAAANAAQKVLDQPAEARSWHQSVGLPRTAPFTSTAVVANSLVEHAVASILGEGAFMSFCMGNTNSCIEASGARAPGSDVQGLHSDGPWLYPTRAEAEAAGHADWPHAPTAVVVNFGVGAAISAATGRTCTVKRLLPDQHRWC